VVGGVKLNLERRPKLDDGTADCYSEEVELAAVAAATRIHCLLLLLLR
jgi:hypothetical protein